MSGTDNWARIYRRKQEEKKARKRQKLSPRGSATHSSSVRGYFSYGSQAPNTLLIPTQLSDDLVAVSVPTWNTPKSSIIRAVGSVLSGSHRHVRVVVISDGDKAPSWRELQDKMRGDPRLICVSSSRNLGPYFLHDAVLRGVRAPFFAVQDSDDESHTKRIEEQLSILNTHAAEAVHSPVVEVYEDGKRKIFCGSTEARPMFSHSAHHFGLYSTPTLMALGGYYAGHRVGYDSCITSFLNLLARTVMTKRALYNRYNHAGSLTSSTTTGYGSPLRIEHAHRLKGMWNQAYDASRISRKHAAQWIAGAAMRGAREHGDIGLRDSLIAQIREQIGERQVEPPPLGKAHLLRVLRSNPSNCAAPDLACVEELYRQCERTRPKLIIDVGSGLSTLVLGLYASRYGARVISLEHDRKWHGVTKTALAHIGLDSHVELVLAPLCDGPHGTQYSHRLKGVLRGDSPDFVFVDGPPESKNGDRSAILDSIGPIRDELVVWLHDGARARERAVVSRWSQRFNVRSSDLDVSLDKRGVWKLLVSERVP